MCFDIVYCVQQALTWTCQAGDGGWVGQTWSRDTGADRLQTPASVHVGCSRSVSRVMPVKEALTHVTVMLAWLALMCLMMDTSRRKIDCLSLSCTLVTLAWLVMTNGENIFLDRFAAWETVSWHSCRNVVCRLYKGDTCSRKLYTCCWLVQIF